MTKSILIIWSAKSTWDQSNIHYRKTTFIRQLFYICRYIRIIIVDFEIGEYNFIFAG
jgi:hypothetical protein